MLLKRKKKKSSSSRKPPAAAKVITSPLPLLDETSLARVYDDTSSSCSDGSSSDEDDNIWDERWVPDENEEEERRLWAAKHKQDQLLKNFNNKKAKSDDERKESRFRDLLDVSPIQRKTVTIDIKGGGGKKRRSSDDGNLPRSVSDDLLTNSDEIKTSEEEDSGNSSCIDSYKPLGTGVAPVPLFFQNRSLSIDENAFVVNRHRSVSLSEEKMKSWKSEAQLRVPGKGAEILCMQPGEDRRLVASADRKKKKSRSEENLNDELEDEEEDEGEKGGKGLAVANNKRAITLRKEKRNRSISVENASTAYSPIAPRRRRALTPQRTPRPFIKSPPTIRIISGGDGEGLDSLDPPSGGGTGEEECLEWKTLWKAS